MANVLRDAKGVPVPQFKDIQTDKMKLHTGIHAPFQQLVDSEGNIIDNTNPLPVKSSLVADVTLHNNSVNSGNGTEFIIGEYKTLNIKITGTSTSRTVQFEVAGFDGVYESIQGVKPSNFSMASSTTGNNESWQFDVTGFVSFRARVTAISGGNVTIKGKAVS